MKSTVFCNNHKEADFLLDYDRWTDKLRHNSFMPKVAISDDYSKIMIIAATYIITTDACTYFPYSFTQQNLKSESFV